MFTVYADGKSIYNPLNEHSVLLEPKLSLELGKSGTLSFKIPANHRYYNFMQQLRTFVSVKMEGEEIFRGRVISNGRDFNKTRAVDCEGDISFLSDTVQKTERYSGSAHALFRNLIAGHNAKTDEAKKFTVGTISVEDRQVLISGQSSEIENAETGKFDYKQIAINATSGEWDTTFGRIESDLLAYIGGYLFTRRAGDVVYIDWLNDSDTETTQEIRFGTNLIDIEEETSGEEIFTVLIPLGDNNLTISKVNNGSEELIDSDGVQKYGRIVKTHVFDNVTNANTLLENARRYLASNSELRTTYTIKAVDLSQLNPSIQPIRLGDKVKIVSPAHGLDEKMLCVKIEYDLADPSNTSYTFGNPKQTLTERYRKDKRNQGRSAGGAGAAASAVADKTEEEAEKKEKKLDAKITVVADEGRIQIDTIKDKLKACGIDIDGNQGMIDIYDVKRRTDQLIQRTYDQELHIKMTQEEDKAMIESLASEMYSFKGEYYGSKANITQAVDAEKARIDILSQTIEQDHDTLAEITMESNKYGSYISQIVKGVFNKDDPENLTSTETSANILSRISAAESNINLKASYQDAQNAAEALLALYADKNESGITLKADKVSLYGMTSVSNGRLSVSGGITSTGQIYAGGAIYSAGHVYEQASGDNTAIQLSNIGHRHKFTYNSTTGQIEIHNEAYEGGSYFFNIADTQTYKNGVSAAWNNGLTSARVSNVSETVTNSHISQNEHHYIALQIKGKMSGTYYNGNSYLGNEETLKVATIDADKVYSDGESAVKDGVIITMDIGNETVGQYGSKRRRVTATAKYNGVAIASAYKDVEYM